jgi:hypothetical protein
MKINHDKRQTICEELERIGSAMKKLIQEARDLVEEHPDYNNWDGYVFRQLDEHVENANPYNQSIFAIIEQLNMPWDKKDSTIVEAWGEELEDEDYDRDLSRDRGVSTGDLARDEKCARDIYS